MTPEINLQQIGQNLAQIRTQQNLSLETVANQTAIAKRVLSALEQGDIDRLPEPFYTKALLKKYARTLGASEVLAKLSNLDLAVGTNSQSEDAQSQDLEAAQSHFKLPKSFKSKAVATFQLKSSHLYCLYILLVAIAVKTIASVVEQPLVITDPVPAQSDLVLEATDSSVDNAPTTISSVTPSQFVSQSNSNDAESVVVDILLKDRCWLKVMVDGRVEFEGTLAKGTQRSWTGKEQINIIAGNAGGVVVTYNHGKEKLLGKPGEVEEVTYRRVDVN